MLCVKSAKLSLLWSYSSSIPTPLKVRTPPPLAMEMLVKPLDVNGGAEKLGWSGLPVMAAKLSPANAATTPFWDAGKVGERNSAVAIAVLKQVPLGLLGWMSPGCPVAAAKLLATMQLAYCE